MKALLILFCLGLPIAGLAEQSPRGLVPAAKRSVEAKPAEAVPSAEQPAIPGPEKKEVPAPQAEKKPSEPDKSPTVPAAAAEGTSARFYGHAFVYLTSSSGVRVAMNPFSDEARMSYKSPSAMPVDIVLISSESPDINGGQSLLGLPQIFRSLTGLGANRANGIPFRGIATARDRQGGSMNGVNTVYVLEMDNLRFCHLGSIGQILSRSQIQEIGRVDVLFLPVGNPRLTVSELWKLVEQTRAKWVVPVAYKTEKSGALDLRPLEDFDPGSHPVKTPGTSDYLFRESELPPVATLLPLKSP